jgi:hypothetical protein
MMGEIAFGPTGGGRSLKPKAEFLNKTKIRLKVKHRAATRVARRTQGGGAFQDRERDDQFGRGRGQSPRPADLMPSVADTSLLHAQQCKLLSRSAIQDPAAPRRRRQHVRSSGQRSGCKLPIRETFCEHDGIAQP